jgi:hypothetical protein
MRAIFLSARVGFESISWVQTRCLSFALFTLATTAALFGSMGLQLPECRAQGTLTPPGPPAPVMKSLDQIEARTPISTVPFIIRQPGSYYLTTNITSTTGDAIDITTNGVTLNLNGFTIFSKLIPANGIGIGLNSGISDITILNGHIISGVTNNGSGVYSGTGFGYGIFGSAASNICVQGVSVSGCLYDGINVNYNTQSLVKDCNVENVGGYGIVADNVSDSIASPCGNGGISAYKTAANCYGQSIGTGYGITTGTANNCMGFASGNNAGVSASVVNNCFGNSISGYGIITTIANNSYGVCLNSGYGVYATFVAIGCFGEAVSGGTGLRAVIANSCYSTTGDGAITHPYNMP